MHSGVSYQQVDFHLAVFIYIKSLILLNFTKNWGLMPFKNSVILCEKLCAKKSFLNNLQTYVLIIVLPIADCQLPTCLFFARNYVCSYF